MSTQSVLNISAAQNLDGFTKGPRTNEEYETYFSCREKIVEFVEFCHKVTGEDISYFSFKITLISLIEELEKLTTELSAFHKKKIKKLYFSLSQKFWSQSIIFSRAISKPCGYPGDYQMMENLYSDCELSESILGQYFDRFFLEDPLAIAVKFRLKAMKSYLEKFLHDFDGDCRVLDLACGSGKEFEGISCGENRGNLTEIVCLDQDFEALLKCQENSKKNELHGVQFNFVEQDFRKFFQLSEMNKSFDLIYNIGLADYLPDSMLLKLISSSIESLKTGGTLVLAHKNYERFPFEIPEWTCDWVFEHRSFDDFKQLIEENFSDKGQIHYFFEASNEVVYFLEFKKI